MCFPNKCSKQWYSVIVNHKRQYQNLGTMGLNVILQSLFDFSCDLNQTWIFASLVYVHKTFLVFSESIKLARWDVLYLGMVGVPPDVVPDPTGSHHVWSKGPGSSSEVLSISDIRLEPRNRSTNSLGTPHHGSRSRRSPTPTWTEGTPSFTESTYSGDPGK